MKSDIYTITSEITDAVYTLLLEHFDADELGGLTSDLDDVVQFKLQDLVDEGSISLDS